MGASSSKSSSDPVDMTPDAFKNLQQPFANVLQSMIGKSGPGINKVMQGYGGPTAAAMRPGETNTLDALMQQQNSYQSQAPTQALPGTPTGSSMYTGPVGPSGAAQQLMGNTAQSGMDPNAVNKFVSGLNLGPQQSLGQFTQGLADASQTGAFGADAGSNPFAQSYIDQAQRQTMQNLEETLSRTLPGRFTQAGHIVQPQGSSAFDRAAAIASRGATQEMGDIASRISYQALESARGREADAMGAELGRGGEAAARAAQAQQAQLDRAMQVPGLEAQIQNLGAQTGATKAQTGLTEAQTQTQNSQTDLTQAGVQAQEVDTMIKNLQAQALPRLIKEMGIERGMEAFQNNVNSMLSVLGIAGGVTRPVISQQSDSKSGSLQLK